MQQTLSMSLLIVIVFLVWLMIDSFMHRYPPGHGDVFPSLVNSGKLDVLLSQVDTRT